MRLLILGGTIFVGRHIVDAALARGHEVTLFNRSKTAPDLYTEVARLRGDRAQNDYASLAGRSFDAVVDTCAYVPRAIREAIAALEARLDGPYVFISSVSAFASLATTDQDEDAPLATLDDTVRPGLIVGPHDPTDRFTYWPARLARAWRAAAASSRPAIRATRSR